MISHGGIDYGAARPGASGRVLLAVGVTGLLAAHYVLAYTATLNFCTTFDEPLNLAAGVAYWTLDDYRLQPENGNLPQRWCTIPLLLMKPVFPSLRQESWRRSESLVIGKQYLYDCGNDPAVMLAAARAMSAIWPTALCLVVFLWSRSIFGTTAALLSLVLAAFWPALVAHGPLATSDACGSLFFTLGAWSLWHLLNRVTVGTVWRACLAVGLAPIAKHSGVMLGPLACVYLGVIAACGRPLVIDIGPFRHEVPAGARSSLARLGALALPALAAVFFIWASCGFRFVAAGPGCGPVSFFRYETLASCCERAGFVGQLCAGLASWRLLPEAWLYGLCYVAVTTKMRTAFAVGHYSTTGWWWYFPLCLAIKNTLPALLLVFGGVATAGARIARAVRLPSTWDAIAYGSLAPLSVVVLLWASFLQSALNIGERHLLPAYPAMMVLAGGIVAAIGSKWIRLALFALAILHAADVASRWPNSLAYFNQVVRPGREYEWLVDSNLDWGQDVPRLERWLRQNALPQEPVFLSYFGSCLEAPRRPGVSVLGATAEPEMPQHLLPGLYCISATHAQGLYVEPTGRWAKSFEAIYGKAGAFVRDGCGDVEEARSIVEAAKAEGWSAASAWQEGRSLAEAAVAVFNISQAGRLRAWLLHQDPLVVVGGSILIFRLSAADLAKAMDGPPPELRPVSWVKEAFGDGVAPLIQRADTLLDGGNPGEAEQVLRKAVHLEPSSATAWDRLGAVLAVVGRPREADAAFIKAGRLAPSDPTPRHNRGNLLASMGRDEEAIAAYDAATTLAPNFREAYLSRALVRLRGGDETGARRDLQTFVTLGGMLPSPLRRLIAPLSADGEP